MSSAHVAPTRSRYLVSERALKLSLAAAPSATPTGSVSSASSASSTSSSSFAVRRKQFRPTTVPANPAQPRVHSESPPLVSLGIVLVVSGARPEPIVRRSLKRPFRAVDREPKERDLGPPREQPRYRPPPPDVPLPTYRRRPTRALVQKLPLYHPSRPLRQLPPLPAPVEYEVSVPEPQATRSSGRARRPPPRNLEHLIVAVSNTARTREQKDKERDREQGPLKKRKVVVLATDEMDVEPPTPSPVPTPAATVAPTSTEPARSSSRSTAAKKRASAPEPTPVLEQTPPVEERTTRRVTRSGKDISVTPTPPPEAVKPVEAPKARSSRAPARKSRSSKGGSEGESTPAPAPPTTRSAAGRRMLTGDLAVLA